MTGQTPFGPDHANPGRDLPHASRWRVRLPANPAEALTRVSSKHIVPRQRVQRVRNRPSGTGPLRGIHSGAACLSIAGRSAIVAECCARRSRSRWITYGRGARSIRSSSALSASRCTVSQSTSTIPTCEQWGRIRFRQPTPKTSGKPGSQMTPAWSRPHPGRPHRRTTSSDSTSRLRATRLTSDLQATTCGALRAPVRRRRSGRSGRPLSECASRSSA